VVVPGVVLDGEPGDCEPVLLRNEEPPVDGTWWLAEPEVAELTDVAGPVPVLLADEPIVVDPVVDPVVVEPATGNGVELPVEPLLDEPDALLELLLVVAPDVSAWAKPAPPVSAAPKPRVTTPAPSQVDTSEWLWLVTCRPLAA
jgi:hypothetical protein